RPLRGRSVGSADEARVAGEAVVRLAAVTGGPVDAVVVEHVDLLAVGRGLGRVRRAADLVEIAPGPRGVPRGVPRGTIGGDVDLGPSRLRAAVGVHVGRGVGGHVEGDLLLAGLAGRVRAGRAEGEVTGVAEHPGLPDVEELLAARADEVL